MGTDTVHKPDFTGVDETRVPSMKMSIVSPEIRSEGLKKEKERVPSFVEFTRTEPIRDIQPS